jgi:hypothetical protein
MVRKMSWKECIEQNIITKDDSDIERSNQMATMANLRFEFWNKKIDDKFIALKIEAYYDIIRELIFALLYKRRFNCTNHLCLIAFLKEYIKDFDYEINKIDE